MASVVQVSVSNQTVTNTSGSVTFNESSTGDTLIGGTADTFVIQAPYTYYNAITDASGGTILGGVNNAFIGLAGNFGPSNGITAIGGNGYSGVTVSDNAAVLNLSGVALSNVTIAANQYTAQTITSTSAGGSYNVSGNNATINGAGHDTFTVVTPYASEFNTYNEPTGGVILAGANNAFIGMGGNVVNGNGIAAILSNGYSGATVGGNSAVLNLAGVRISGVAIDADQANQAITTTQGNLNYTVSTAGDTFNGVGGDVFSVVDGYNNYNAYNDLTGGTVQAGTNNALLGFSNSLTTADGVATLSANGHTGVQVGSEGAVLNTTGITLSGVGISLEQNGQTVTVPQSGLNYTISTYGDTINAGGGDTFTVADSYIEYNAYNDVAGGTLQAGTNNALLGFSNSVTAADGISTLSANGHTGVLVGSNGAVLNLTGITLNGVGIDLSQTGQTVTAPQSGLNYRVSNYNDVINGGGNDTFTVVDTYNNYNTYNDIAGGTLQAGTNNALLGFTNSLTTADGITTLSANGYTGVDVASNGAVLNLTGITLNGVGVSLAQTGQTVTAPQSGLQYKVSNYNDIINGGGNDTFTVVDSYNNFNTYNDISGGTLQAGTNNALLGFSNSVTAADGISTLSANGYTGVMVASQGAVLNLTGITLNGVGISAGQGNQVITAPQSGLNYKVTNTGDTFNGGGGDTFTVDDVYTYANTYNDIAGGTIQAGMNNAVIGLAGNFGAGNGIATISGNGYSGVVIQGGTAGATLDFSQTNVSDATIRGGANNVTIIGPSGNQTLTGGGQSDVFAFTAGTGNDVITDFRAGSGGGYDVIDLNGSLSVPNFASLLTHIQQVGANAVITLNNGGTITLDNVNVSSLKANNFNFGNVATGLAASNGTVIVGHGQSVNLTSAISGLITQGTLDGVATATTVTALSSTSGTASVASGVADYTAPASGTDTASYSATDQFGDVVSGQIAVTVDAGPMVASGALAIGHGQSQDVTALINGLITKGLAGDTETVTSTSGNLVQNAQGNWIYTAPASGNANATFTVTDQHGDAASGQIAVTSDPGPSVAGVPRTINLSTGQNAAGVVQQTNDSLDANWQITGAVAAQDAPNAYVVGTNGLDFGYGGWMCNDASSSWIAAAPNNPHGNGDMTATDTFTLSASDIAHISSAGGGFTADDSGTLYINGHEIGSDSLAWASLTNFSIPTADLVVGTNTLTLVVSNADDEIEGVRVQASIQIGPTGYLTVGHGQSQDVTALINGLITPGAAGDTETVTSNSGDLVKNAQGHWIYTAPNGQTADTANFTVTDQFGNSTTGSIAVTIDQGPVAANDSILVGHNQNAYLTTVINNLITPGLPTDAETVTAVSGAHSFLGGGNVIYGAPSSGSGSFTYTVTDQLGETSTGSVSVKVDTGPVTANTSITVGHGQTYNATSLIDGLITKGVAGDTETITAVSAAHGTATLNATAQTVSYVAPVSGTDTATYTVTDQLGDVSTGTVSVTVDAGPTVANGTLTTDGSSVDETAYLKSLVTPGISGDTETITAVSGNAMLGANGSVTYTPNSAASSSFTYTVTDEEGDTATGTVNVTQQQPAPVVPPVVTPPVASSHSGTVVNLSGSNAVVVGATSPVVASGVAGANVVGPAAGYATITGPVNNVTITAQGYDNTIIAGGGSDTINAGLDNAKVTVSDTNGNNTVTDALGTLSDDTTVTLGNGNDSVSLRGYGSTITLGDGNDTVSAGVGNDTITVGNGNDTVTTGGYHNVIHVGSGTDVINAGLGNDSVTIAGGPDTVIADGYSNTITSTGGDLTVSGDSGYSTITLGGDNNTLLLGGYNETVTLGLNSTGNNSVAGSLGSSVIITGAGNQSINASGYFNIITTGAGDSTINAGAGYETVNVGSGINSINASGNNNDITTNGGEDTVALSGWNNTINVHAGLTMVSGGYENTYNVDSVGNSGGLEIADFNAPYGDVLNLDAVLKPLAVGGVSLASLVTSTHAGNDMLISVITAGGSVQVADLQGLASSSLSGLIASHSVLL